jgi:hypothetical protein
MKRIPYAASGGGRVEHYRAREPLPALVHSHAYRLVVTRADYVI